MRFTVVVPLYNKGPYVRQTLESVLNQTLRDFEVVVVDDGSTDDGAAIAESLGDPRIRVIRQANAGVSAARNRGIAEARGDWVSFLDADDWWHPQFLQRMSALAAAHPEAHFVASAFKEEEHGETWRPVPWSLSDAGPVEIIRDLPRRWAQPCFCTDTVALRRPFLLALMPCFPVGEKLGEDLDLWFRAAERSAIAFLAVPLACYRTEVPGSLMGAIREPELLPVVSRMRDRALSGAMPSRLARSSLRFVSEFHVSLARSELAAGRRRAALRHLRQGWRAMIGHRWWYTILMLLGLAPAR